MTLSASDPWATVVAAKGPGWAAGLEADHPELGPVTVAVRGATVAVDAPHAVDKWAAAWLLACEVAGWWPGWLHPAAVGCEITVGGVTLRADGEAMFDLAAMWATGFG